MKKCFQKRKSSNFEKVSDLLKQSGHHPQCNGTESPCCEEATVTSRSSINKHQVINEENQSRGEMFSPRPVSVSRDVTP